MANVKISTINTTQGYQQPVNPNADGVVANGFYPQNSTSNDANAGIERATGGELNLKAGGNATVAVHPPSVSTALVRIANSSSAAASLQIDAPTNDVQGIVINGATSAASSSLVITGDTVAGTPAANIRNFNNCPAARDYAEGSDAALVVVAAGAGEAINATGTVTATTFSGSGASLTSIPNSATTATSANTANAIVARNASGNFSAGTVTATLFSGSGASLTSIPNSATTATSSSTANAIVARDSGAGFSAGNVSLSGLAVTGGALGETVTVVTATSSNALRITQTGSGNAILVEDSANPDSTPFVVTAAGAVAVGTLSPGSGSLVTVAGQIESTVAGYKFPDGTTQSTSAGTITRLASPVTTTSTTFTDITGMTASLATATAYFFEAYLIWQQNNTAGGIGFAINGPGNMGVLDYTIQYQNFANDAAGTIQTVHSGTYDSAYTIPTTTTAANTNYIARISGVLVTTITAGTFALRFKSNNASYTASIRPGSWLLLRRGNT